MHQSEGLKCPNWYISLIHFAGATLYKSINRVAATSLAGSLGLGVHWISYKSGEKFEPIIIGISVFFLGM